MKIKIRIALLCLFFTTPVFSQNREHAYEVNQKLGRGINFGNMFEAPAETEWGNPWKPGYAEMIAGLGFNHIRIPIRWETAARSSATPPYTINGTFLNRIKQVVDSALNHKLLAVINMHHHDELFANPDGQKERFLAQWRQISAFFKDYPDSLVFEILNEPNGNMTKEKWNVFAADALAVIREDNPTRIVLITTPDWGGLGGLPDLQLPDDDNLILTIHYYNPFQFTHQGASWVGDGTVANEWLGTKWNDSETERMVVQQDFAPLVSFEKEHHIPVHIGEFGSYSKADLVSREKWTTYLSRYLETLNWSWAYWEFSAGFGIYNPSTQKYTDELVDALLHNEMPEPAHYAGTPVYKSNFNTSTDGWNLYNNGTAAGNLSRADNSLKVVITNGSSEGWHVQLVKNSIQLKAGKKYRYSFKAKAETARSFTCYIGMSSSPYSAYSGYNSGTATDSMAVYTFVFDQAQNDNSARVAFDLGKSEADFTITDFLLEEIVLVPPTNAGIFTDLKTTLFPNPVSDVLQVNNLDEFSTYSITNLQGAILKQDKLNPFLNQIKTTNLPNGFYFILLDGKNKKMSKKLIKQN